MKDVNEIIFYGAHWCNDCKRVKQLFGEHEIDYVWKDIEEDESNLKEMLEKADGENQIPTLDIDGDIIQNPTNDELISLLEIDEAAENYHEVVSIGAGPTALTASIYTTREDIDTMLLEKGVVGGLAAITDNIENYPGFPEGISGMELATALREQAERFGAQIDLAEVQGIENEGRYKRIKTTEGDYLSEAVLIATGSDYKRLGIPGEEEFYGRGVHYCATCDGALYRDQRLVVVGGGNSAAQEGLFLTKFASKIDMLVRSELKASDILVRKVMENDKINIHYNTTTDQIMGEDGQVTKVIGTNKETGEETEFETDGVFVFIGLRPNTEFLRDTELEFDEYGFIKTTKALETNIPGIFAAGDVRSGATMQIASAVGEGATAALMIREYLENELD